MVSLPCFLKMAAVDHRDSLHRLKTMKGQLSSFMSNAFELMTEVGEKPCSTDNRHGEHFDKWGEILYKLTIIAAYTSQDLERLTNDLREESGLKPLDYSDSPSTLVLGDWLKLMKEQAPKFGVSVTDEGKLVRS